jgi:hypothetical protein
VLPALLAAEPALRTTLARTMRILADEDELLATMAAAFARDFAVEQQHPGEVALDRAMMATLSRAMQRRTVRAALDEAFPEASRLESVHIEAIVDGLADDAFARDLACGLRAFSEYGKIVISHRGERFPGVAPSLLPLPGSVDLGPIGSIEAAPADPGEVAGERLSVVIDAVTQASSPSARCVRGSGCDPSAWTARRNSQTCSPTGRCLAANDTGFRSCVTESVSCGSPV